MKGYVKLTAATLEGKEGIGIEMSLTSVSVKDKISLISSLSSTLGVGPEELKAIAMLLELIGEDSLVEETINFEGADKLNSYMKKGGLKQ